MKKMTTLILTAALALSLSLWALASEPEAVRPPAPVSYTATLVLNGSELDASGLPAAPAGGMLPLRLIVESDHGAASWDQEENAGRFYLGGHVIAVDFATGAITVDSQAAEGAAQVAEGVTFVPAGVIGALEGYSVELHPEMDAQQIDITTPNSDPMIQLGYQLLETAGMGANMKATLAEMEEYQILTPGSLTRAVGFLPMMISPDTLILGKVAPDKLEQVKTDLENYRKNQEDTFTWYLADNLPKVQNAQVAFSGEWVLFVIGEHAVEAVEQFQAAAAALE